MSKEGELSPEEKLLRLIKSGKSPQKSSPPAEENRAQGTGTSKASVQPRRLLSLPRLGRMPRILALACVLVAGAILIQFVVHRVQRPKRIEALARKGAALASQARGAQVALAPNSQRLQLPAKNLFRPLVAAPPAPERRVAPAKVISLNRILANYVLGGIVGGERPQAIIEDKGQGKTFFLSEGDTLGEIRILKIGEGKVTVSVGNEQADLDL